VLVVCDLSRDHLTLYVIPSEAGFQAEQGISGANGPDQHDHAAAAFRPFASHILNREFAVIRHFYLSFFVLLSALLVAQSVPRQTSDNSTPAAVKPADVSGKWQISWEGRLGAEQCTLDLHQDGAKLTGTLQDLHGVSPISGTVVDKEILFDAQFSGKRPFTIRFKGTIDTAANAVEIKGTSQAVGIEGSGSAYLGHAGEVTQPEHPWSAKRPANRPATESVSNASSPVSK
jgi:hypothetical protein